MKMQLKNEYGVPFNLQGIDSIKFMFPYHNGKTLEKSTVDIISEVDGIIRVKLSDFEIQGLCLGEKQTFYAYVTRSDEHYKFEFRNALTVKKEGERKVIG